MKNPIIGITLDYENNGGYSKFPWYAIRENYLNCLYKFGAIPFPLFPQYKSVTLTHSSIRQQQQYIKSHLVTFSKSTISLPFNFKPSGLAIFM